jgi:superfamily II DNA or RNA helicase
MARRVRLRPWQKRALDLLAASPSPDFLTVATPGAGKTTFALCAAIGDMAANPGRRLVVVAPTSHLKVQWADAAARLGVHLDPRWSPTSGRLPADVHGVVTTYQQVASNPDALRPLASRSLAVLDEVHHAGDERAWGEAVRRAFEVSPRRLSLSGTPFRSDTRAIPFVSYVLDEARPDFEYGYADALADGRVVRPVYFPRINGFMEWVAPDGSVAAAAFDDALDKAGSAQRLRTALSLEGEWLATVLLQADERLASIRKVQPDAGGLVIAADQDHAKGIADVLRYRCGRKATVAVSDDPTSSSRMAKFAAGTDPWIVAVRMVSEGVDIPRLRVGVYATTTTTDLFFRQAVGRFVRWTRGVPRQKSYLFIPDDPRLRTWASQIADARRHSLRKPSEDAAGDGPLPDDGAAFDQMRHEEDRGEQLSMFAALSAVVTGDAEES